MKTPVPTPIYHITHINNLCSIIQSKGCFSHNEKQKHQIKHKNIAHDNIQDRRVHTHVPCGPGGVLHDYIPFFFAPRPPMLYAIHRGYVESYNEGQEFIVYLVSTAQAVNNSGCGWIFTDGHGTMEITEFYDDLQCLDEVDWDIMNSRYWSDTAEKPDRKRRRQAEFLIKDFCPWKLIYEIGIINSRVEPQVQKFLKDTEHKPSVRIHRDWYY